MHLVQVGEDGAPRERLPDLPPVAKEVLATTATMYQRTGFEPPWVAYLAVNDNRCIGTCAFKSSPRQNRVEIAYFTFPEYEGRGYATRMAQALVDIAKTTAPGITITAQTLRQENASTHILAKLGFERIGSVSHPIDGPLWEWHLAT